MIGLVFLEINTFSVFLYSADYYFFNFKKRGYFIEDNGDILIDKYLIITKAPEEKNLNLIEKASKAGVTILFDSDVKRLLSKMAKAFDAVFCFM